MGDLLPWGIAAFAFVIRIPNLRWGLPELEEEALPVRKAFEMWGWDRGQLTLDPQTAGWPHLSFHLHLALQKLQYAIGRLTGRYEQPLDFYIAHVDLDTLVTPARLLSIVAGAATVVVGVRLARRLVNWFGALTTGLALALSPLLIEYSIKVTPDVLLTLFSALALAGFVDIYEKGRLRDYVASAVWIALGAASKYTPVLLIPCLVGAHLARHWSDGRWRRLVDRRLVLALAVCAATFCVATPFTILNVAVAKRDISSQFVHVTAGHFGHELRGAGHVFYLGKVLPAAFGWPAVVFGLSGLALATWRRRGAWMIVLLSFVCYVGPLGALRSLYPYYILPALLPVALGLGALVGEFASTTLAHRRRVSVALGIAFLVTILTPLVMQSVRLQLRYARPSTGRQAKDFVLRELVRPGASFACELGGPNLPRDPTLEFARRPVFARLDAPGRKRLLGRPFVNHWSIPMYMMDANGTDLYYDLRHYLNYDYVIVSGNAHQRYTGLPDVFPRQNEFYGDLNRYCELVRYFPASSDRLGPDVWIYAVDSRTRRILDDRGVLSRGFHLPYMQKIRFDALDSFLANTGMQAKRRLDWQGADLYFTTLVGVRPPQQRTPQMLLDLAKVKYNAGRRAEAQQLCMELVQLLPDDTQVAAVCAAILQGTAERGEQPRAAGVR